MFLLIIHSLFLLCLREVVVSPTTLVPSQALNTELKQTKIIKSVSEYPIGREVRVANHRMILLHYRCRCRTQEDKDIKNTSNSLQTKGQQENEKQTKSKNKLKKEKKCFLAGGRVPQRCVVYVTAHEGHNRRVGFPIWATLWPKWRRYLNLAGLNTTKYRQVNMNNNTTAGAYHWLSCIWIYRRNTVTFVHPPKHTWKLLCRVGCCLGGENGMCYYGMKISGWIIFLVCFFMVNHYVEWVGGSYVK